MRRFFPEFEGLRGITCLLVALYHIRMFGGVPQWYVPSLGYFDPTLVLLTGMFGCDFFFVLSGFCLTLPYARAEMRGGTSHSPGEFYRRRFWRVAPAYYVAILMISSSLWFQFFGERITTWRIVSHMAFIHSLIPSEFYAINGVFWSVGTEAHFYLLFPVILLAFRRWGLERIVAVSLVLCGGYRAIAFLTFPTDPKPVFATLTHNVLAVGDQFLLGMAFACLLASRMPASPAARRSLTALPRMTAWLERLGPDAETQGWRCLMLGVGFMGVAMAGVRVWPDLLGPWGAASHTLVAVGLALIFFGACLRPNGVPWLRWGPLTWLGRVSFSYYLYHFPIQLVILKLIIAFNISGTERLLIVYAGTLLVPILLAGLSYHFIEYPLMVHDKRPEVAAAGNVDAPGSSPV